MNVTKFTVGFLQNLLQDDYPDVTVHDFKCEPGTEPGDNISAVITRIIITGTQGPTKNVWDTSIICKQLPAKQKGEVVTKMFHNEAAFYKKAWPALQSFQKLRMNQDFFNSIPKCYKAQDSSIILHDLKKDGFVMGDRREGLSLDQSYLALKHLAHFHALSLFMKYYDPEGFLQLLNKEDGISEVLFVKEQSESHKNFLKKTTEAAISWVADDLIESANRDIILDKFKNFCSEENLYSMMVELVSPREPLSVICHGDCWTNNLLFKCEAGEVVDMRMVDFQLVRYTSVAIDLIYILYLSLERNLRIKHLDDLIKYYGDELRKHVTPMNGNDPGILDNILEGKMMNQMLHDEVERCLPYGLGIALNLFPIMTLTAEDINDQSKIQVVDISVENSNTADVCLPLTANKDCKRKLTQLILDLIDEGLL